MIKMIITDIDGTIVKDASTEVCPEFLDLVEKLIGQGYLFVAASGRASTSICHMFRRIKNQIAVIAENGAHILYQGKVLSVTNMEREHVEGIMADLRDLCADGQCQSLVSTGMGSMIENGSKEFIDFIQHNYKNRVILTEDVLKEDTEIMKVSIFKQGSIREIGEQQLIPKWNGRVKACMAGEEWVDFMDVSVDKGHALHYLMEYFGVKREEVLAFGDNANDIGMLKMAGTSYAVENAREEVRNSADRICPSYQEKGVYRTLLELVGGEEV